MKVFRVDRETASGIGAQGSVGASHVECGYSTGEAHLGIIYLEAGGLLGDHEAPTPQLFLVVEGQGWVRGDDGRRREIRVGDAVLWEQGEMHGSGTDSGMTVVVMQARDIDAPT